MKIKKGDTVLIISGKDRAKLGKVVRSFPSGREILVEGVNMVTRHIKPRQSDKKGEKIQKPMPFNIAKVKLVCPQCKKATRIGYAVTQDTKVRVCKQCGKTI